MDETGVMLSMLGSVKVLVGRDDIQAHRGANKHIEQANQTANGIVFELATAVIIAKFIRPAGCCQMHWVC
jgi:hypothetical protein